jgi:hypothetical protein
MGGLTLKNRNWTNELPHIIAMIPLMDDRALAAKYQVSVKVIRDMRRNHGIRRESDKSYLAADRMPRAIAKKEPTWDFHGMDLG